MSVVEQIASAHAGRTLVKGCAPWLLEDDIFKIEDGDAGQ